MSAYEWNKVAGAVLGSLLLLMIINEIGNILVHPVELDAPVLAIEMEGEETTATAEAEAEDVPSLAVLLASADAAKGAKVAKKCAACHSFDAGGKNKIGPALYGVIGRGVAADTNFSYSGAMRDVGNTWTYEQLDAFLADPKGYAPGTKMSYAGLKKPTDRANLLAYMAEQHDAAPPYPSE